MASSLLAASRSPGPRVHSRLADFPKHNNSLNFIRLVLAGLVIVSHSWPIGGFGDEPRFGKLSLGAFAVAAFFVLSGWLITQSRMSSELPSYLWRRFCRIYPGYFAALLVVAFVFAPIGAAVSSGEYHLWSGFGYVTSNIPLNIRDWTVGSSLPPNAFQAWNGSLWTLRYEVACYLVVGFVITLTGRRWIGVTTIIGLVMLTSAAVVWQIAGWPNQSFAAQFIELSPFFFAGAALFAMRGRIPLHGGYATLAAALAGLLISTGATPAVAALPITYFFLWLGATLPGIFQRIGRDNDISYGTYIYAFPVQQLLALLGGAKFGVGFYILFNVIATLPIAAVSWFAIEKPAQRLRRAFDRFPVVRSGYGLKRRPQS